MISIIIPALNEAQSLPALLRLLQPLRKKGHEVIVADGGSHDATVASSRPWVDHVVACERGRAVQMNRGATFARGDLFWFLHADTLPSSDALDAIQGLTSGQVWGRFNVHLSGRSPWFRMIEWFMNRRSCLTGIVTGDQGLFMTRILFDESGGFPAIPLMEDIAISRRLKKNARPICLSQRVTTSSRRWEERGILRTVLLMWYLRLRYFFGTAPHTLQRIYYGG